MFALWFIWSLFVSFSRFFNFPETYLAENRTNLFINTTQQVLLKNFFWKIVPQQLRCNKIWVGKFAKQTYIIWLFRHSQSRETTKFIMQFLRYDDVVIQFFFALFINSLLIKLSSVSVLSKYSCLPELHCFPDQNNELPWIWQSWCRAFKSTGQKYSKRIVY